MAMRRRSASGRNVHVDQAELTGGIFPREKDRIGVADHSQMRDVIVLRSGNYQLAPRVVWWDR
jgi:hypothetical protein